MQKFLTSHFTVLLFFSAVLGVCFPENFIFLNAYSAEILMLVLWGSFLGLDFPRLLSLPLKSLVTLSVFYILGIPALFYLLCFSWMDPVFLSVFLLFFALPSGMANPAMSGVFSLDKEWATAVVVCTSLLFPFLFTLFSPLLPFEGTFSLWEIFIKVGMLIFIPFVLALGWKKYFPKETKKVAALSPSLTILGLMAMIAGILSANTEILLQLFTSLSFIVFGLGMFFAYGVLFCLGYLFPAESKKQQWTNVLLFWGTNPILFLVLASEFFAEEVFVGAFFAEIFWIVFQIIFTWLHRKYYLFR